MSTNIFYKYFIIIFFLQGPIISNSQNVYKTPYGKKYHLASCRMVENVSSKLVDANDVHKHSLTACSFCRPPAPRSIKYSSLDGDKGKGVAQISVQCKGRTQKGTRCRHKTKIGNGYCYQHTSQA